MKRKVLSLVLIMAFALSTIFPIISLGSTNSEKAEIRKSGAFKSSNAFSNFTKKEELEEDTSNYTEEYKHWLELSDEEKAKCAVIPRKYNVPFDVLYEEETQKATSFSKKLKRNVVVARNEEIPEKFDLRDKIEIPVRNQGSYGLCWNFASMKSLETNLALNGYGNCDFSELHLDYLESEEFGKYGELHDGRNFSDFEDYVMNGYGPVLESEVPYYAEYSVDDYDYLLNLENKVFVGDTINFPRIVKKNNEYSSEQLTLFRNKVKKHIMKNGSLYSTICAAEKDFDGTFNQNTFHTMQLYNGKVVLNYQGEQNINHAVSIIGWDDNFSRENFPEECRPKEDGAYIAMNSWGENGGDNGVFYISYEDIWVESELSGVVNASTNIEDTLEKVEFEDINLYHAIKEELGRKVYKYNDDTLTIYTSKLALDKVRYLNLENKNISSLKGIEKFSKLNGIQLANNNIENVEYLRNFNDEYMGINLENNKIKDVSPLCNFSNITISNNPIETGLNNLNKVNSLMIDNCELSDLQLEQIAELSTVEEISLQNDNLEDVSCLAKLDLFSINLSQNKNIKGIEKLINVYQMNLSDCSLDNSVINKLNELKELQWLDLSYNNITDVTGLKEMNLYGLNLSGNKGIKLNTIQMNGEVPEDEYYGDMGTSLFLNDCDIEDISELKSSNIYRISLGNNPISDVSPLNKISELYLDGNKNLTNLDKLENVNYLYLNDCNIKDFTFINSLKNLQKIELCNNNIKEFPTIANEALMNIDLSNNKLQSIPDFSKVNAYYINLKNNEINDISNIESLLRVESNGIVIDLSQNKIKQVPQLQKEGTYINVSENYISDIPENGKGYQSWYEQDITGNYELEVNKENRIPMPQILKLECQNRYKNQSNFITENCSIDYKRGEIIINPSQLGGGKASVKINSESYNCKSNGTTFDISFEAKENINMSCLELGDSRYKDTYVEGNKFDSSNLIVKVVYENGLAYEITDYEITNEQELNESQENITIKYKGLELQVPITVFSKDNYDILFGTELYDAIYGSIRDGVRDKDVNQDEVRCIVKKETIDKLTKLDLSSRSNIDNWRGLSSICNLRELDLPENRIENSKELFSEICQLKQLEQLKLKNCYFPETGYFADSESMKEVLKLPNIKLIDFGERRTTSHGYIEEKYYYLPKYLTKDDIQNIKIKYTYKNSKQEDVTEDMPLYVDENNNLYVVYDTEVTEDKIYGERLINIDISTEKIKQKINDYYEFNFKPTVKITGEPLNSYYGRLYQPVLRTNSNSVVYTFTWFQNVDGFTKDSIIIENGEKGEFKEVIPNQVYTLVVTNNVEENKEDIQTITINENSCIDKNNNANEKVEEQILIDRIAPTCEITANTDKFGRYNGEYTLKWSEGIVDNLMSAITVENGTVESIKVIEENKYKVVVKAEKAGEQKVYIEADKCKDYAGNGNKASNICTVQIDRNSPNIEIKEYTLEDNRIKDVKESTTISEFKKNVTIKDNTSYKIVSKEDKELKDTDIITTGSKIEINSDNNKTQYIICVTGDTTGDGHADIKDILSMNKHRLDKTKLENEYFQAGDINKDGKVDIKDILQLNKFRLGKISSL